MKLTCGYPDVTADLSAEPVLLHPEPKPVLLNAEEQEGSSHAKEDSKDLNDFNQALKQLLMGGPNLEFLKRIAITRNAKLLTMEDIDNHNIVYGGYENDNTSMQELLNGFERREVTISLPTINRLPYENPNERLQILYYDEDELLDIY